MRKYNSILILVLFLASCANVNAGFKTTAVISKELYDAIFDVSVNETERIVKKFDAGQGTEADREVLKVYNKLNHALVSYKATHNSYVLAIQSAELAGEAPPDLQVLYQKLAELKVELIALAREVGILK